MRILLPPSESKRDGVGASLDLQLLTAPGLAGPRDRVLSALEALSRRKPAIACPALGITERQVAELARNLAIRTAPTAPAHDVYTGVLFDGIDYDRRTPAVRKRMDATVLVQSALFGIVGFADAIPAYRCSADSALPRLGRVGTHWKRQLGDAMRSLTAGHCIVDLRSGSYAAMWSAPPEQLVTVRVVQDRDGQRVAVSHFNKATKGLLVAELCSTTRRLEDADAIAAFLTQRGWTVDAIRLPDGSARLDVLMLQASSRPQ